MRTTQAATLAIAVAAVLAVGACGTEPAGEARAEGGSSSTSGSAAPTAASTASPTSAPTPSGTASGPSAAAVPGAYLTRADYEGVRAERESTRVVLFFHAPWCPSCRGTEAALKERGVPEGLTVVKVDFDGETDLRRQYGVTQQHTFVQVDAGGAAVRKWTGSEDGAAILAETT